MLMSPRSPEYKQTIQNKFWRKKYNPSLKLSLQMGFKYNPVYNQETTRKVMKQQIK